MTEIHAAHEPTILIVDDDAGAIQVLGRMLAGFGRLRFATRGEDALVLSRQAVPDLVLLDEGMPGLSGFDVCRAMKADPALAHVPVIFITSFDQPDFEVQALRLGAVDFITKPCVATVLQDRVRAVLRVQRQADAALRAQREQWQPLGNSRIADIVAAAADAVVSVDAAGHIVLINAAACRLLSVSPEQALGAPARQRVPFLDTLLARAATDPAAFDRDTWALEQAGGRACAVEASLSCLGEGAEQITTLILREVTRRFRLAPARANAPGQHPPEHQA
ncbi:MAG: hypothetical protein CFE40_03070 [Burkholderiales bacterium PBB1]|nr:MAG: hypothetical protein CFE40_03070 [Burkholderiales bacterium PBB1]